MSTSTLVAAPTAQHPFIAPEREPHLPHLVRSRDDLLLNGWSERGIGAAVRAGELFHIRRGWYMTADDRASLSPEQRHHAHVIAVARDAHEGAASHTSAGVLWRLPFYRVRFARVHLTTASPHRISSAADVMRHVGGLAPEDVAVIDGIRCTSLARTVFDLIRILPLEAGVGVADAAERMMGLRLREWDLDAIASWRGGMQERIDAAVGARGIRQARWVADFADGRAQLPGESVSRLQLHRLGFAPPDLQVPVAGPHGADYLVDFGLDDVDSFGEFDGKGKYLDEAMRSGRTFEQVMLAEKQREDWIRGRTQRRMARWGSEHIRTPRELGRRLAAFGITPP